MYVCKKLDKLRIKNKYLPKNSNVQKTANILNLNMSEACLRELGRGQLLLCRGLKALIDGDRAKFKTILIFKNNFYVMFKNIYKTRSKTVFHIPIKLSGDHFVYSKWGITVMIDGEISKHFRKFSKSSNPITGAVS